MSSTGGTTSRTTSDIGEVEKSEITPLYHVTYEVEDEGKKVDIEFEDIIRVKLDEDGNWNSILLRGPRVSSVRNKK